MRLPFPHVLALALGLASGTGAAGAQDVTRERVQAELDRTDQRIEQSEMVVSSSNNEIAETALNDAIRVQAQAKSAFAGNQLRIALDLTLRARTLVLRAIALVRGLPDPDRVLAQLERTREMLERGRERIEECNDDPIDLKLHLGVREKAIVEHLLSKLHGGDNIGKSKESGAGGTNYNIARVAPQHVRLR